jgi:hypothetical protein
VSVRLDRPFRAPAAAVRGLFLRRERERDLFDLLCAAGQLVYRLPHDNINLNRVRGPKDPRRRLKREFADSFRSMRKAGAASMWTRSGDHLCRVLLKELSARGGKELRPLRVLLAYSPGALAPDCAVPRDRLLFAAWRTVVKLFARLFPSDVSSLGPVRCVDDRRLTLLRREAAAGLRRGRRASGTRAGPEGRRLAVDPRLMAEVGRALGRKVQPGYQARHLFYTRPGDHFWPHPDDPAYDVQVLLCVDHQVPRRRAARSALLTYRPNGRVQRHEIAPGEALAVMPGRVHAREPMRPGEKLIMLSLGLVTAKQRARR